MTPHALVEVLALAASRRQPGSYGVGEGEAAGLVVLFLVVVAGFFVVSFFAAGSFLVVAAVELGVVVTDSFLLAHDVIKPKTARTAMDVISDCFISL